MQYKFNRHYLCSLLVDIQKKYDEGILSISDYKLLNKIIKELILGSKPNDKKIKLNNFNDINLKLNILKSELGIDTIETLLYISDTIIRDSSYINIHNDYYKQSSSELVTNVLQFYKECDKKQYDYLNEFAHNPLSQLEIVTGNLTNKEIFETIVLTIPVYNLDFIRIVKENSLYDEASLCHEFRHILDIRKLNTSSTDLNVFSETNSIAMELYYEMIKINSNYGYKAGIERRLNHLREMAIYVKMYMELLLEIDSHNCLTRKMIENIFKAHSKEKMYATMLDLDCDSGYQYITYLVGILKGMHLCNLALEDPKESFKIQDNICSIMKENYFIPRKLEDVLGKEFVIGEKDIENYKIFMKRLDC